MTDEYVADTEASVVVPTYEMLVTGMTAPDGVLFIGLYLKPKGLPQGATFPMTATEARELSAALVEAAERLEGMAPGGMVI